MISVIKMNELKWSCSKKKIYNKFVKYVFKLSETTKPNGIYTGGIIIDNENSLSKNSDIIKRVNEQRNYYDLFCLDYDDMIDAIYYDIKELCDYQGNKLLSYSNSPFDMQVFLFANLNV